MLFNKEELEKIRAAKKKWEEEVVQKTLKRFGAEESPNKYYTPADLPEDFDFLKKVGFPGQYPFATGRYPVIQQVSAWGKGSTAGVKTKLKRAGRYSGFGTPENTRDHYIETREKGFRVGGPNLAFDLPTQTGRDSDDEFAEGEVGKVGVSVDTLRDFEVIYEAFTGDMDLDKIASNFTINGSANIIIAMLCALAEKRGIPLSALRGTPQNDILKEFVARGTQIFPVKPSMRMTRDSITFCVEHMPNFNIMSICGYHMREFGATRTQTIAFSIANAIAYYQLGIDAGLDVDKIGRQITWLNFGGGMEALKEYAVRRAAKIVWAKVMRERFKSSDPRNWIIRELGGMLTGYWTATKQRPLNNLTRTVIGGVFSAMQGDQPLLVEPPYDEALGLGHSLEAQQLNEDASRIITEECKLAEVLDPFAGSYYIESLTDQYEKEIWEIIKKIDAMGGAAAAVESGWMKEEIMRSSYEYQRAVDEGKEVRVGMNKYTDAEEIEVTTPRTLPYDPEKRMGAEKKQVEKLKKVKKERDNEKVQACLKRIKEAAQDESVNLIPLFIEAVKEYTSEGEICGALKEVFGEAM
jgi:methylmalonyl-CoA mutase N-terminal domain/subunit